MCLIAKKGSRKIATEDIPVYKIIKATDDPNKWDGPYYKAGLPFDQVVEVDSPDENKLERFGLKMIKCKGGFLHSFLRYEAARSTWKSLRILSDDNSQYLLTRAIIPKGAIFYTGYQDEDTTVASNKLIVEKPTGRYTQD